MDENGEKKCNVGIIGIKKGHQQDQLFIKYLEYDRKPIYSPNTVKIISVTWF